MAATPSRKLNVPAGTAMTRAAFARNVSDCINFVTLVAATAQKLAVPADAKYVEVQTDAVIYFRFGLTGVVAAAVPNADVANGSGIQSVAPGLSTLIVPDGTTHVSIISAGTPKVTLAYFK